MSSIRSVAQVAAWGALVVGCASDASRRDSPTAAASTEAPQTAPSAGTADPGARRALDRLRTEVSSERATLMPLEEARGFAVVDGALVPRLPRRFERGVAQTVRLPLRADAPWTVGARGLSIDVALQGAAPVPARATETAVVYEGALGAATTMIQVPLVTGTEELVRLEHPRTELRYDVTLHGVAGLRLAGGILEVLDAQGTPVLRTTAPALVDAKHTRRTGSLALEGCAYDPSAELPFGRTPTPPGAERCVVVARWDDAGLVYPIVVDPGWTTTARLIVAPRIFHTATAFSTAAGTTCEGGCVLVVGGSSGPGLVRSTVAELYSVAAAAWTATDDPPGSTALGLSDHGAAETGTGLVMIGGGSREGGPSPVTSEAALYDPLTAPGAKWKSIAPMPGGARHGLTAVHVPIASPALTQQTVVFVGGLDAVGNPLGTVDQYSVRAGKWLPGVPQLSVPRYFHATVAWGAPCGGICPPLPKMAVAGGVTVGGLPTDSIEVIDFKTGTEQLLKLSSPAVAPAGVVVGPSDGFVVFAGGLSALGGSAIASASVDAIPAAAPTSVKSFVLGNGRGFHAGAVFGTAGTSHAAIFAGGRKADVAVADSDRIAIDDPRFAVRSSALAGPRVQHRMVTLADGSVMAVGGATSDYRTGPSMEEIIVDAPSAAPCAADGDCSSAHCADGVCCDRACTGQCEACDVAASPGMCVGVDGAPHGARTPCIGADPRCGGRCEAAHPAACVTPTASTVCIDRSCKDGAAVPAAFCNGAGGCAPPTAVPCGNYACVAGECKSTCATAGDCAKGFTCDPASHNCLPTTATCTADGTGSLPADRSAAKPCLAYRCNPSSGDCYAACTDSAQCAPGSVCDGGGCVTPGGGAATLELPGCGVSAGDNTASLGITPLAALAGLGLLRRRARRRSPPRPRQR